MCGCVERVLGLHFSELASLQCRFGAIKLLPALVQHLFRLKALLNESGGAIEFLLRKNLLTFQLRDIGLGFIDGPTRQFDLSFEFCFIAQLNG